MSRQIHLTQLPQVTWIPDRAQEAAKYLLPAPVRGINETPTKHVNQEAPFDENGDVAIERGMNGVRKFRWAHSDLWCQQGGVTEAKDRWTDGHLSRWEHGKTSLNAPQGCEINWTQVHVLQGQTHAFLIYIYAYFCSHGCLSPEMISI